MPRYLLLTLTALTLACSAPPPPEPEVDRGAGDVFKADDALDAIVPADYKIEKLAGGMVFTEGPLWIKEGGPYLIFSDVRGNCIYRWNPGDTAASVFRANVYAGDRAGGVGPNGLNMDARGRILACEHANRRISRLEDGEWTTVIDNYQGKKLNSPNDLAWHPNGGLYFTDPPYGLAKLEEDPARELDFNGIYRLDYAGGDLELLVREQSRPNGIGFSPDGKTAYVANSDAANKAWMAYDVTEDGKFANGRVFYDVNAETAEGMPDGLKLDKQGNLYCTGPGGVWIFTPDGAHLGTIRPDEVPANVAWGDDGKTLYMTARTGLYRIALNAEGRMPADMGSE